MNIVVMPAWRVILFKIFAHVFLPLLAGLSIYMLFRAQSLIIFDWFVGTGLWEFVELLRARSAALNDLIPGFMIFSLPDALWVYSLTSLMLIIWNGSGGTSRLIWISLGLILGAGAEIGQLLGLVRGTFDAVDLLLCIVAAVASLVLIAPQAFTIKYREKTSLEGGYYE